MLKNCGTCGWYKPNNHLVVHGKCSWPQHNLLPYWTPKTCVVLAIWGNNCLTWKPLELDKVCPICSEVSEQGESSVHNQKECPGGKP